MRHGRTLFQWDIVNNVKTLFYLFVVMASDLRSQDASHQTKDSLSSRPQAGAESLPERHYYFPRVFYKNRMAVEPNEKDLSAIETLLKDSSPWTCAKDGTVINRTALAVERFLKLPSELQSMYRETHSAVAEKELREARQSGGVTALMRVAQHHGFTDAGDRALVEVISKLFNDQEIQSAELYFTAWLEGTSESKKCENPALLRKGLFIYKALDKSSRRLWDTLLDCLKKNPKSFNSSPLDTAEKIKQELNDFRPTKDTTLDQWAQGADSESQLRRQAHLKNAVTFANAPEFLKSGLLKALGTTHMEKLHFCELYDGRDTQSLLAAGSLVPAFPSRIPELMEALGSRDSVLSGNASNALAYIGEKAAPALMAAFETGSLPAAVGSKKLLLELGEKAVPLAIQGLGSKNADVKQGAARLLIAVRFPIDSAVPTLISNLNDENLKVRKSSAKVLATIGKDAHTAVPALIAALDDADDEMKKLAASAIEEIGEAAHAAIPALSRIAAIKNKSFLRFRAVRALGSLGEKAVPAIIAAVGDGDKDVRLAAVYALATVGTKEPKAIATLASALGDEDREVRARAGSTLGEIGEDARTAIPALNAAIKVEKDVEVRGIIEEGLQKIQWSIKRGKK